MGGKASKGTPADRRLKENRQLPPRPPSAAGKPSPMMQPAKAMQTRRGRSGR